MAATNVDAHVPGNGIALDLTRTYSSANLGGVGPFGYGWTDSYNMAVATDPAYAGPVEDVTQENGSLARFTQNSSGGWTAPSRLQATLAYNASSGQWSFTRTAQDTYTFNSSGQLTTETDLDGYTTTLTYTSGKLTAVTDPAVGHSPPPGEPAPPTRASPRSATRPAGSFTTPTTATPT